MALEFADWYWSNFVVLNCLTVSAVSLCCGVGAVFIECIIIEGTYWSGWWRYFLIII